MKITPSFLNLPSRRDNLVLNKNRIKPRILIAKRTNSWCSSIIYNVILRKKIINNHPEENQLQDLYHSL